MNQKHLFLSFLFLLNCIALLAQKQTANWMMYPDSYHFLHPGPGRSTQHNDTFSFSSSMSDQNGNLLFYTNGFDVWNKTGQKMQGSGFILNKLPFQCCGSKGIACVIVPSPSDTNRYYIFGSVFTGIHYHPTSYAIVDMNLNSGMGKVVSTQNIIDTNTSNVIAAVKHCNNKDFWIVTHRQQSHSFLSILVSSQGVSQPVESKVGGVRSFGVNIKQMIKISPNGKYVALVCGDSSNNFPEVTYVFPFNDQTGVVQDPLLKYVSTLPTSGQMSYGNIEFSSDSKKVYIVNRQSRLIQFDLSIPEAGTIKKSADSIDLSIIPGLNNSNARMMQLSLSGKIFVLSTPSNFSIDDPNIKMASPFFKLSKVAGQSVNFPFFAANYFNKPYSIDSFCLNQPTVFRAFDVYGYDSIRWEFGDSLLPGHTSTDSIAHHTFSGYGTYTTKLKVYKCNSESVFEIPLSISSPSGITFSQYDSVCINTPPVKLNIATPDSGLYYINGHLTDSLYPSSLGPGTQFIVYKTMNDSGCWSVDSTPVTINPLPTPVISLSRSSLLCEGDSVVLESNYMQNKWSNGLSSRSIVIKKSETVSLTVTDSAGCKNTSAPVSIISKTIPVTKIAPVDTLFCAGASFVLSASGDGNYSWSNGYTGSKQTITASQTQTFRIKVSNYCGSAEDSVHITVLRSDAKAYPNPALTYLSVDLSECEGTGQSIEILDEIGRTIRSFHTDHFSETIDVSSFADGLYFCRVGKENLRVFKFVILR